MAQPIYDTEQLKKRLQEEVRVKVKTWPTPLAAGLQGLTQGQGEQWLQALSLFLERVGVVLGGLCIATYLEQPVNEWQDKKINQKTDGS